MYTWYKVDAGMIAVHTSRNLRGRVCERCYSATTMVGRGNIRRYGKYLIPRAVDQVPGRTRANSGPQKGSIGTVTPRLAGLGHKQIMASRTQ